MTNWKPTENQVAYVTKLLNEKVVEAERANWLHHLRQVKSNADLDRAIKKLQALPYLIDLRRTGPVVPESLPNVESAHYALGEGEHWTFYHVSRPVDGKWAGRVFLDLEVSDNYKPLRSWNTIEKVLAKIALDPKQAAINYGLQSERCSMCHRKLTNDDSRKAGIGPVCANKVGW